MSGASHLIEEMKRKEAEKYMTNLTECKFCRYLFNKTYEDKCPICSKKLKEFNAQYKGN